MSTLAFKLRDGNFNGGDVDQRFRIGLRHFVHAKFLFGMPDLRSTLVRGVRRACQSPPRMTG